MYLLLVSSAGLSKKCMTQMQQLTTLNWSQNVFLLLASALSFQRGTREQLYPFTCTNELPWSRLPPVPPAEEYKLQPDLGSSSIYPHKHWQIFGHNKQGPLWTDWCWSQNNYKIEFPSDFSSSFFTFICTAADLEHWARCGFLLVGFLPCCGKTWNCSRKKSSCCMSACTSYLL